MHNIYIKRENLDLSHRSLCALVPVSVSFQISALKINDLKRESIFTAAFVLHTSFILFQLGVLTRVAFLCCTSGLDSRHTIAFMAKSFLRKNVNKKREYLHAQIRIGILGILKKTMVQLQGKIFWALQTLCLVSQFLQCSWIEHQSQTISRVQGLHGAQATRRISGWEEKRNLMPNIVARIFMNVPYLESEILTHNGRTVFAIRFHSYTKFP